MIKKNSRIFFSGIGGSGVSALAGFMAKKGHIITGSDRAFDNGEHPLKSFFPSQGISLFPQDGSGINESLDLAVFSTAIEADHPEILKAKLIGIPLMTRPELLADITRSFRTVAVAGTSGKSTVSGMLAFLMERLGLSPNFLGGGRVSQFRSPSCAGNSLSGVSETLVIEACESDGSIIHYKPEHTIILNLDLDHHSINHTSSMFQTLMDNTTGKILLNYDDVYLDRIRRSDAVGFSIEAPSDYRAENIHFMAFGSEFNINKTTFSLSIPGKYNVYNALSCIALLSEIGIPAADIADVLPEFLGIERRFDIHLNDGVHLVIDDYAHNPHKIEAMMRAASAIRDNICYIFQPHGYAPTKMMKDEYIKTFSTNLRISDRLILLPIYYAGGTVSKEISSRSLAEGIRVNNKTVDLANRNEILHMAALHDTYVIFGARDESLSEFAHSLAGALNEKNPPHR
ncbi:MAG: hypothetical protein ISR96_04380 [Nitrospira sp.]|nr:hypothetical protein [Nitrospira sp.]